MKQHTVTAHVFMELGYQPGADGKMDWSEQKWAPTVWKCRVDDQDDRIYVGEQIVTVEVPEDFNPIPSQVAALEAQKAAALAQYQKTVAEIQERLSKLLAITNEAT